MKKATHLLAAAALILTPGAAVAGGHTKYDVGGQTPPTLGRTAGNCTPVVWIWPSWLPCFRI